MSKRPKIGNTMLLYFFTTILAVFILVALGFNVAVRGHVVALLNQQLEEAKALVLEFAQQSQIPRGPNRSSMFHRMMIQNSADSSVNILFLNEAGELTLPLVNSAEETAAEIQGMGMGMGWQGGRTNPSTKPATNPGTTQGPMLRLDDASYRESLAVHEYVQETSYQLADDSVRTASIDGENYYLQSIPFSEGEDPEYVLAFIDGEVYDRFIGNALWILTFIMGPVLVVTFFVVRYLAQRLANPIARLQGLSKQLGRGVFEGEDFHLREQELVDLNESLNEAAHQLKDYHANQKTFFQNVSHELRTPLTGIRGYAEGIKYGVFTADEAADVILEESGKLEKLVEDILYLSRIESNESLLGERTPLRLSELLLEAREDSAHDARLSQKTIEVVVHQDPRICVYYEELHRALQNLVSNAVRYADSLIQLEGTVRDDQVVITVSDDGHGIVPGSEEKIFQRFTKGPGGRHGIGLSIAEAAVERHGGTIAAKNRTDGPGAVFSITLPLQKLQHL